MSRRVGVAADDGHARQRESLFGAYDVDDAIVARVHGKMRQMEVAGVACQCFHLTGRDWVLDGLVLVVRGRVMVRHTENLLRTETLNAALTEAFESLWRGDLMAVEAVNIELGGTVGDVLDDVGIPYLVEEG